MAHFPQPNPQRRAPRIHLGGSVAALVMLDDGQRAKGKLQTISITGGLLRLGKSLGQGDFVEIAFQTQSGPVHGMAEMLSPMPATRDGYLQPFRFVALEDGRRELVCNRSRAIDYWISTEITLPSPSPTSR